MSPDTTNEKEREVLEQRVEALAGEIAELINTSQGEERNDLRDLALSIVREEVRSGAESAEQHEIDEKPQGPFNPIAMGIPIFLLGALLFFLFPPMALALFALAGLMVAWGVAAMLFAGRG